MSLKPVRDIKMSSHCSLVMDYISIVSIIFSLFSVNVWFWRRYAILVASCHALMSVYCHIYYLLKVYNLFCLTGVWDVQFPKLGKCLQNHSTTHHFHCYRQLGGANNTSSQQGHAVTSLLEYFGPQPFANDILTDRGSTGPMLGKETAGGGQAGSKMHRQWPGATLHTSKALAAAASRAGELTNTGSWLRL